MVKTVFAGASCVRLYHVTNILSIDPGLVFWLKEIKMRVFDVSFALQVQAESVSDAVTEFVSRFGADQADGWFFSVVDLESGSRYVYDTKIGAVIAQAPIVPTSEDVKDETGGRDGHGT